MKELMPRIACPKEQPKTKKREEIKLLITDEEITEANNLSKRKKSKKNPLTEKKMFRLEELTARRKKEKEQILPEIGFKIIAGLTGTREESSKQYELANNYFESIAEMAKTPGAVYNLALRLEKLQNYENDPKNIDTTFRYTFEKRKNESRKLIQDINNAKRLNPFTRRDYKESLSKLELGDITEAEMDRLRKAANNERLIIKAKIPDHLQEAVLFDPALAKEAIDEVRKKYYIKAIQRKNLKNILSESEARIKKFEDWEKNYKNKEEV